MEKRIVICQSPQVQKPFPSLVKSPYGEMGRNTAEKRGKANKEKYRQYMREYYQKRKAEKLAEAEGNQNEKV